MKTQLFPGGARPTRDDPTEPVRPQERPSPKGISTTELLVRSGLMGAAGFGMMLGVLTDRSKVLASELPRMDGPNPYSLQIDARSLALDGDGLVLVDRGGELILERASEADGPIQIVPPGREGAVYLFPDGRMSLDPEAAPDDQLDQILALALAAEHDDRVDNNLFAPISEDHRTAVLDNLTTTLEQVPPAGPLPAWLDEAQALEVRTSTATLLLEIAESTSEADTRARVAELYDGLVQNEPRSDVRQALALQLSLSPASASPEMVGVASALRPEFSPVAPDYDAWLEDGVIDMTWTAGGREFKPGAIDELERIGFEVVSDEDNVTTLEKEIDVEGHGPAILRVNVQVGSRKMFDAMADEESDIVFYDGHSDYGRNVERALEDAPESPEDGRGKLIFVGLCLGKYNLDSIFEQYPNAQIVTTFGPSIFRGRPMYEGENIDALFAMLGGIEEGADWATLHAEMEAASHTWDGSARRLEDAPWGWERPYDNYITPYATYDRERAIDRDDDGVADYIDEHYNVDPELVEVDPTREFEPIARDGVFFDGAAFQRAGQAANRFAGYNEVIRDVFRDSRVVADGYFVPGPDEPDIVRVTAIDSPDGEELYLIQLNADFAHMSEETLRAVVGFELNRFLVDTGRAELDPVDAKINGLMMAHGTMSHDHSYRDREIWSALLEAYNFPEMEYSTFSGPVNSDHDLPAGNRDAIDQIREALPDDVIEALEQDDVGVFSAAAPEPLVG